MRAGDKPVWTPAELHHQLDAGSPFAILDVRNRDEFEAWRIEGRTPVPTLGIPYYELVDLEDEEEDIAAAVARSAPERLKHALPREEPVLAVCAQGDTSAHVAEGLRRLGYRAFNLEGGMAAWGNHYETRAVEDSGRLAILQVSRPARGCLGYLLASGGQALVVDAARHIQTYTRLAGERGWRITAVLDTHLQADHQSGGPALARAVGAAYRLHPYDAIHPEDLLPATFDYRHLEEGMSLALGEADVEVMHLPGHTLGMVNLRVDGRYLLSGDTLFIDAIGRPDLGGRAESWAPLLHRSLQRLLALPDDTMVLPAHFSHMAEADGAGCYRAELGALRRDNEGLLKVSQGLEAFTEYILASLPEHPPAYDAIRRINTGLEEADEARAGELELGRNRCALSQRGQEG